MEPPAVDHCMYQFNGILVYVINLTNKKVTLLVLKALNVNRSFMHKAKLLLLSNEVWDNGSYLSTRITGNKVVNTYGYEDYFIDIVYDVNTSEVIDVIVDELFNLAPSSIEGLHKSYLNLN